MGGMILKAASFVPSQCCLQKSEGAAAASAETAAGKSAATTAEAAASAPSGTGRTGTGSGNENLVHVVGHEVHRIGKEDGIEATDRIRGGRDIPGRRIANEPGKFLRPDLFDAQGHGKR